MLRFFYLTMQLAMACPNLREVEPLLFYIQELYRTHTTIVSEKSLNLTCFEYLYTNLGSIELVTKKQTHSKINLILNDFSDIKFLSSEYYVYFNNNNSLSLENIWYEKNVYNIFVVNGKMAETFNPASKKIEKFNLELKQIEKYFCSRFMNWNGSNLYSVMFEREPTVIFTKTGGIGFDYEMLSVIAFKLNMLISIVKSEDKIRYGYMHPNGSYAGAFNEIIQNRANITGNNHFITWHNVSQLTFTHFTSTENLCLIVPKSKRVPHIQAIFKLINIRLLFILLMIYFLAFVAFKILIGIRKKLENKKIVHPFFMFYRILIGVPVNFNTTGCETWITTSLLLMGIVIINFFQSALVTVSSSPLYFKSLDSLDDLRESKIEIWLSSPELTNMFSNDDSLKGLNIQAKTLKESQAGKTRKDIGRTMRLNVLLPKTKIEYFGEKSDEPKHITKDCLVTYFAGFVLSTGSPLEQPVNRIIERIIESGIAKKWTTDVIGKKSSGFKLIESKQKLQVTSVKFKDVSFSFLMLTFGLSLSTLSFIFEMIKFKLF